MLASADAAARLLQLTPAQVHAAHVLSEARAWHGVGALILAVLMMLIAARVGWIAEIRARLERHKPRRWLTSFVAALLLGGVLAIALGAWSGVDAWREARLAHTPHASLPMEMALAIAVEGPMLLAFVIGVPVLYALMRVLPRLWWMAPAVLAVAFAITTIWLPDQSVEGRRVPAPPGPVTRAVADLIRTSHLPAGRVGVSALPGRDAEVLGDANHARVLVTPGLLASTSAEARAAVGHVMGHHAHNDMRDFALMFGVLAVGGLLALQLLWRPVMRLTGALDVAGISAPETMPALTLIAVLWLFGSATAVNSFIRVINVGADQYSLDAAREPDGLRQWLKDDWRGDDPAPAAWVEFVSYDHPSLSSRLDHIAQWEAANTRTPPAR